MDGDDLSDDVFIDKNTVINSDELRIDRQIPTIPISSGAKAGGGVGKDEDEVRIYAPLDYDDACGTQYENYFYPDNEVVSEGWRSYKIEDEHPFGPITDGPAINNHNRILPMCNNNNVAAPKAKQDFDANVTHKVNNKIIEINHLMIFNRECKFTMRLHCDIIFIYLLHITGHYAGRFGSGKDIAIGALSKWGVQSGFFLGYRWSCLICK